MPSCAQQQAALRLMHTSTTSIYQSPVTLLSHMTNKCQLCSGCLVCQAAVRMTWTSLGTDRQDSKHQPTHACLLASASDCSPWRCHCYWHLTLHHVMPATSRWKLLSNLTYTTVALKSVQAKGSRFIESMLPPQLLELECASALLDIHGC